MIETVVIKGEQCKKHYFNVCPSVGCFFFSCVCVLFTRFIWSLMQVAIILLPLKALRSNHKIVAN